MKQPIKNSLPKVNISNRDIYLSETYLSRMMEEGIPPHMVESLCESNNLF